MAATETAIVSLEELRREVLAPAPVVKQAEGMVIESREDFEMAGTLLGLIAERRKAKWERCSLVVTKNHEAWKAACDLRNDAVRAEDEAARILNVKMRAWDAAQERTRRAEEARLAATEKARLDAAALEQAAQLEAAGEKELAEAVIEQQAAAPAPVIVLESSAPRMSFAPARESWKFRIVDEALIPREFLSPDERKIGAVARSQKGLARIPGVEIYAEKSFHGSVL